MSDTMSYPINSNHSGKYHKSYDVAPGVLLVSFARWVEENRSQMTAIRIAYDLLRLRAPVNAFHEP